MKTGFNLTKARDLIKKTEMDCIIATSQENFYYCSGAPIQTIGRLRRLAAAVIPLDDEPVIISHINEEATARKHSWIKDIRTYEAGEWEPLKSVRFVANVLEEKGLDDKKIGISSFDMSGLRFNYLREQLPSAKIVDAKPIFDKLRSVKSTEEVKILSEANMSTAKAITAAFESARPEDTEKEIALNMISLCLKYGADTVALLTLAAGENLFENHHLPTDYRIKKGDMVHVDFGCFFKGGYISDIARTFVVGEPNKKQLKVYDIAVRAEKVAAEAMVAGTKVIDVHNAVKKFYESEVKGYNYTRAFIGHSVGLNIHESPFIGPSDGDWVLEPGNFIQIEPGMSIENARAHIEDSHVVQTRGPAKNVSLYNDTTELMIIK